MIDQDKWSLSHSFVLVWLIRPMAKPWPYYVCTGFLFLLLHRPLRTPMDAFSTPASYQVKFLECGNKPNALEFKVRSQLLLPTFHIYFSRCKWYILSIYWRPH